MDGWLCRSVGTAVWKNWLSGFSFSFTKSSRKKLRLPYSNSWEENGELSGLEKPPGLDVVRRIFESPPVELGTCPRCWSRTVAWWFAEPSTQETRAEAIEGMWWIWGLTARDHKTPLLNGNILPNVILFQFSYCRWFSLISMISSSLQWHDLLGVGLW